MRASADCKCCSHCAIMARLAERGTDGDGGGRRSGGNCGQRWLGCNARTPLARHLQRLKKWLTGGSRSQHDRRGRLRSMGLAGSGGGGGSVEAIEHARKGGPASICMLAVHCPRQLFASSLLQLITHVLARGGPPPTAAADCCCGGWPSQGPLAAVLFHPTLETRIHARINHRPACLSG